MYVPGTVNADEQQMGSIFSAIGKAIGGVIKIGESALGIGPGGDKKVTVTLAPGQSPKAAIVPKDDLAAAAKQALSDAEGVAGKVPTWVWIAGAGVAGLAIMAMMSKRR